MSFYEQDQHQFTLPTITQTMEVDSPQPQVPNFITTQMAYSTTASINVDSQDHGSSFFPAIHGVSVNDDQQNPSCSSYECVQSDYPFINSLPPGIRFQPTDYELIRYYLIPKVNNQVIPPVPIRDVNLYEHSPDKIAEMYQELKEGEGYFFTPRDRKYPNGFRPNRGTGCGYWKATGSDKHITEGDRSNKIIGLKKTLVYYEGEAKSKNGVKTNWIMHEYCVMHDKKAKRSKISKRLDDFILCRIYKKGNKTFQSRQPAEVQRRSQEPAEVQGLSSEVAGHAFGNGTPFNEPLQSHQQAEVEGLFGNGMLQDQENMGNFDHSSGFGNAYLNNFELGSCNVKDEVALPELDNLFLAGYNSYPYSMW